MNDEPIENLDLYRQDFRRELVFQFPSARLGYTFHASDRASQVVAALRKLADDIEARFLIEPN